jgi:hypothetical protein
VSPRWFSRRSLLCHLATLVVVPGCLAAFWWQLHRALDGNALSWAYTFEWPIFAVLGVIAWWQLVHDDPGTVGHRALRHMAAPTGAASGPDPGPASGPDPGREAVVLSPEYGGDPELTAYNRYLAELAASGRRKSWRHS